MTHSYGYRTLTGLVAVLFTLFLSGCATTTPGLDRVKGMNAQQGNAVVIGKVRLIKNGKEVNLANNLFAGAPRLHLTDGRSGRSLRAKVGSNGEFAWPVDAEFYNVSAIEFVVNGRRYDHSLQRVLFPTYLTLTASEDRQATYVGTITLEIDIDFGYQGMSARAMGMNVTNECDSVCDRQLAGLGLGRDDLAIQLLRPDLSLAAASVE